MLLVMCFLGYESAGVVCILLLFSLEGRDAWRNESLTTTEVKK